MRNESLSSVKRVCLLLGGNLGDRVAALRFAAGELALRVGELTQASEVFESEPWGSTSQEWYLNQAIELRTSLFPEMVLKQALAIELDWGRTRSTPNADRTLDIDILLMEDVVIETESLKIPHPRLLERRFALLPLSQIASANLIPKTELTVSEALIICPDLLAVRPLL